MNKIVCLCESKCEWQSVWLSERMDGSISVCVGRYIKTYVVWEGG